MRSAPRNLGKLRIVGGSLRGSRIEVANGDGLRPTSDRVRETLFNWLAPMIEGARCLDLFAGTGALGIEAISRGAAECVFVERDRALAQRLQQTLARLNIENARVINADALGWLGAVGQAFNLVFLDPPFSDDLWADAAARLEAGGCLAENAWIHVEAPAGMTPVVPSAWHLHRESRAGAVNFALYRRSHSIPLS
ncbi:MAG TPA: 16S rRNA (guanine(966)-N(2))-methyltransferase RsmD [Dokdonella sp.]|uniref:16S rRNA (guanine(966)-N(2))-methyltransferase RsmD n=1 Tax=Dokdonella sp. TaxID=2291710 RepID=UPI002D7F0268|nr:16S rRNA (guanine(966)-N(2))-methyltransferase RsmD [Dokdonella sp.]HET9034102.1 16S rRNA (guanine(966)-N(2))-methyltransferase RsmD [Dokdonella sp.]